MYKFVFFSISLLLLAGVSFSQSDKYMQAMQSRLKSMDELKDPAELKDLSAAFERIGDAEKNKWQPYYYAALSMAIGGYNLSNVTTDNKAAAIDPFADKAEMLLNKAMTLSPDNSELYVLKKMINTLKMTADPMNRYMQLMGPSAEALATAKKLNPDNPRIYLLEGQDKFFTPEQFGGSKAEAKKLFELALQKYEAFKPENELSPKWGKELAESLLAQIQ